MQAQGYIQSVGDEVESFWKESNGLAEENDMDQNLAYMFTMIQKAHGKVIFNQKGINGLWGESTIIPPVLRLGLSALETMAWKEELL